MVGVGLTRGGWTVSYGSAEELDGHVLYFLEDSRALRPGYVKTIKWRVIPLELYMALSDIEGWGELGRIRRYRSLVKDISGLYNISIQLDLWG